MRFLTMRARITRAEAGIGRATAEALSRGRNSLLQKVPTLPLLKASKAVQVQPSLKPLRS